MHALNFEIAANQIIEIGIARKNISTHGRGWTIAHTESDAKLIKNIEREKCNLSFVIILEIKKTIAPNAATGDAFDFWHFDCRMILRLATGVTHKIMPRRNVKVANFH